jgi:putative transposase
VIGRSDARMVSFSTELQNCCSICSPETAMKSDRHVCVTMNYIHHNPVKHGLCEKGQEWTWSSAKDWLARVGREEAQAFWMEYPVKEYGRDWDV